MIGYQHNWQNWRQQEGGDDQAIVTQGTEHFEGWNPIFYTVWYEFKFNPLARKMKEILLFLKISLSSKYEWEIRGEQWWEANNGNTLETWSHLHCLEHKVSPGENPSWTESEPLICLERKTNELKTAQKTTMTNILLTDY